MESHNQLVDFILEIYTDGACKNNPGPGGWAGILIYKSEKLTDFLSFLQSAQDCFKTFSNDFAHFKHFVVEQSENSIIVKIGGKDGDTTNNRMEMLAVINSLYFHKNLQAFFNKNSVFKYNFEKITLFTDSMYVKDGIEKWIYGWEKNNWKTAQKKPVKNQDLWQKISSYNHGINWQWVQGHSGDKWNDEADKIAKALSNNM